MIDAYWLFRWYALTSMAKVSNNQTLQCRLNANEYTSTLNAIITKRLMKFYRKEVCDTLNYNKNKEILNKR